jgi:hypothetical protein
MMGVKWIRDGVGADVGEDRDADGETPHTQIRSWW